MMMMMMMQGFYSFFWSKTSKISIYMHIYMHTAASILKHVRDLQEGLKCLLIVLCEIAQAQ